MNCDVCKKRPATVHYTTVMNGVKEEYHLCEQCAAEVSSQGELFGFGKMSEFPKFGFLPDFSMADFVGGFFNGGEAKPFVQQLSHSDACPFCKMTVGEFRKQGRVGCAQCYEHFGEYMPSLLRRIHGSTVHTGKVPKKGQADLQAKRELAHLKEDLQKAIQAEDFEQAAILRDKIKAIQQKKEADGNV